ncbi:MAG: 16S rRNA (cytidine(1402)-2'-O)-methyltransferase [Clostridiaceae bacterium]
MSKLYVVPTPIGNLKDITLRALETLQSVDCIAAEDTRQTIKLLNHYNIKKPLISYHQHNELGKSKELIDRIRNGQNIALVSDAGSPGISDPGSVLIKRCIEEGIDFEVLPGATAIITALVASGCDTSKFAFRGFLPRESKEKKQLVEEVKNYKDTLIFYEAPHRLLDTLRFLRESFGNRNISVCKELTKMYETFVRGTLEEVIEHFSKITVKGEFVIVLEGKSIEEINEESRAKWETLSIEEHIIKYIDEGFSKKEAVKKVAKDRGLSKSEVYKAGLEI